MARVYLFYSESASNFKVDKNETNALYVFYVCFDMTLPKTYKKSCFLILKNVENVFLNKEQ